MAPDFMAQMGKRLRRRSLASFFSSANTTDISSNNSNASNGTAPSSGSITPLSDHNSEPALDELAKQKASSAPNLRPVTKGADPSKRHSVSGMSVLGVSAPGTPNGQAPPPALLSQYAPRITNMHDGVRVCQKATLIQGTIGEDPSLNKLNGFVTVTHLDDSFPPTRWPVTESHFKALVYMTPGPNKLQFDFSSPKLAHTDQGHISYLNIIMIPPTNAPPLQLAIIVGRDSPAIFDSVPARAEKEGNGLETAIQKFRMAAYLWQAFTADDMSSNRLGRRAFRFEEEWVTGTSNHDDMESGTMRSEARVHVFQVDKTVEELRALDQDMRSKREVGADPTQSELFMVAADAVRKGLKPLKGQKIYVAAMLLDSHWDPESKEVSGHVAAGGRHGSLGLALFGSHCLQSYPGSFQEVVPAFTDCTPTDTKYISNDGGDAGKSWEMANVGIGGHLRQIGRMFGCHEQESGIMNTDFLLLNRSFVSREAYSSRTKSKGGLVRPKDQGRWHRLDCLRFFHHPCFKLPGQRVPHGVESIEAWPIEGGNLTLTAPTGIAFVEIFADDDVYCSSWNEYFSDQNANSTRQVTLSEQGLREKLPLAKRHGILRIGVGSVGGGYLEINDFRELASGSRASLQLSTGKIAFRSKSVADNTVEDEVDIQQSQEIIWSSAVVQQRVQAAVNVYHNHVIAGIEFIYDDGSSQLLGARGNEGDVVCTTFELDIPNREYISGLSVKYDLCINALRISTSLGRRSLWFGDSSEGFPQAIVPPRGFTICGAAATSVILDADDCALQNFSVLITR